jgi:hypothetical protein
VPLGASLEETAQSYMTLPAEFQRIEDRPEADRYAMKACIKEYNATLPQVKTSGSRDALLEQLAIINPDLVAQEAQKPVPLKVSGTKADMIQAVKSVNPDAVFADELLDAWRENPGEKILVTRQQLRPRRLFSRPFWRTRLPGCCSSIRAALLRLVISALTKRPGLKCACALISKSTWTVCASALT